MNEKKNSPSPRKCQRLLNISIIFTGHIDLRHNKDDADKFYTCVLDYVILSSKKTIGTIGNGV